MLGFHVTPTSNLMSIRRSGLLPGIGRRSMEVEEPEPGIWLFPSWRAMEDAQWLYELIDDDETIAILLVDLDRLDVEEDLDVGYELCVREQIASSRITVLCQDMDSPTAFLHASQAAADALANLVSYAQSTQASEFARERATL